MTSRERRSIVAPTPGQHTSGFSLVELVMVLLLVSVIAGTLALPMSSLLESQRLLSSESVEKTDIDYTLGRISSAIRAASAVTTCTADTLSLTVNGTAISFTRADESIVLDGTEQLLGGVRPESVMCDGTYASTLDLYRVTVAVDDGSTVTVMRFRRTP